MTTSGTAIIEHRILTALFIDCHRPRPRWLSRNEIASEYHVEVEKFLWDAILSELKDRGLIDLYWDQDRAVAQIDRLKYRTILDLILSHLGASIFEVRWDKEEITTDALGGFDSSIPSPSGWKIFQFETDGKPASPPSPAPNAPHRPQEGPWTKWGVIIGALALVVAIVVPYLTSGPSSQRPAEKAALTAPAAAPPPVERAISTPPDADTKAPKRVPNQSNPIISRSERKTTLLKQGGQSDRGPMLQQLTQLYILSHDGISPEMMSGLEAPPVAWVNDQLGKRHADWRVTSCNGNECETKKAD